MKRTVAALILALAPAWTQTLTRRDRDYAMSQLHASRKMFLDSIAGLSSDQWNFKPAPDRWSIAECAEHITLTEDVLFDRVQQMLKSPAAPEKKPAASDEEVYRMMLDRSRKAQAPEAVQPARRWATPAEVAEAFKQKRDRTIAYVESTQDALRAHFDSQGRSDAFQWLLGIAGHTERHVAQINEVKADPKYPKE